MNAKAMACVFLGILIGGACYGTLTVHKKLAAMKEEESKAKSAYEDAESARKNAESKLANMRRDTQGKRDYLKEWLPYLQETKSAGDGERLMVARVRESGLTALSESYRSMGGNKNNAISNILQGKLVFVADYAKTMDWLGKIETSLPASRVASFKVSKGSSGNDIRTELVIDVPMYAANADAAKK
ncbi:MAG: hypothetical protein AAGA58_17280 [Verrucomicrobiota bacterium]